MSDVEPDVLEEYQDNRATGVEKEIETDDLFEDIERPWNPESIRVTTKSFSLRNILDLIKEHSLEIAPDFQRQQVWSTRQKAQLIESLLLQIPLPAFYFAEDNDGAMAVVDGLQRLSTIQDFVQGTDGRSGGFKLKYLEYISDVEGKYFEDLPAVWQRRIYNTQIVVHVIDASTPSPVKYDIFRRINTGGTPLNSQEIRHCMSKSRSRNFLKDCAELIEFRDATQDALFHSSRMVDREVILRFMAFRLLGSIEDYRVEGPMERLLLSTTIRLDDPSDLSDEDLDGLRESFITGLENSIHVFGDHAFRKWTFDETKRRPFNRALFESWTYALSLTNPDAILMNREEIAGGARTIMSEDPEYVSSITVSTGDPRRVEYRFRTALDIVSIATK